MPPGADPHLTVKASDYSDEQIREIEAAAEAWQQGHAETLADERKDEFTSSSGRTINALYTPADVARLSYLDDLGFPGQPPFTRGESAAGYRGKLWNWEFYAGFGSASDANKRYRYLLEQGGTGGVSIALDLPTQIGLDPDHPLAQLEIGRIGVSISTLQDVLDIFDGIELKKAAKIFTTANCIAPIALAWFYCLAEEKGEDATSFVVTIQNDPLKEYVARGTQFLPVSAAVELACDVIEFVAEKDYPWYPISVSGAHMKQAGGSCAQEVAFTLANALAYIDRLRDRNVAVESFAPKMELHFSTDMDFFEEVAKYRVARRLWSELLKERYGAEGIRPRLHGVASGAPLTAQQPLNNVVRIALEVLAQVFGGVAQTRTACYDEALAIPTEEAVKLSIRTNQIIAHETGIPDTVDPLAGSYYVEATTLAMYEEIRRILEDVDERGGAISAVESGHFSGELADESYRRQTELEEHRRVIVGVNEFVEDEDASINVFRHDPSVAERQLERLAQAKASRDQTAVDTALGNVRTAAEQRRNCVPAVIEAVRAGATTGEIAHAWRGVYGEWRSTLTGVR
ncbi:MAG TPA: methylmalonyl-CoA mutase family protein [Gaiellaceae bacterium]|nr:methylmalonyl-CoA mutase family protein [Gaiellaceae bacterium]